MSDEETKEETEQEPTEATGIEPEVGTPPVGTGEAPDAPESEETV